MCSHYCAGECVPGVGEWNIDVPSVLNSTCVCVCPVRTSMHAKPTRPISSQLCGAETTQASETNSSGEVGSP